MMSLEYLIGPENTEIFMMKTCEKDIAGNLKRFPLAKSGTI